MIDSSLKIDEFIDELSTRLDNLTDIYVIGGGAMMYSNTKAQTKDIDLVVRGEDAYRSVRKALLDMKFASIRPGAEYARMNLSDMFEREDGMRIDLFDTRVCGKLELSEGMVSRSTMRHTSGPVRLHSCCAGDILIFKSITSRDGDVDDCMSLVESGDVDWASVLNEIRHQISDGEEVWITWIADRLVLLHKQFDIRIPVLSDIVDMADDFLARWEMELLEKSGIDPNNLPRD